MTAVTCMATFRAEKSVWRRYEAEIEENACLISVSHPFLAESIINRRDKIVLAPNACSEAFLARGQMAAPAAGYH